MNPSEQLPKGSQYWRWEKPEARRYYTAQLAVDLLGDWVVMQTWGSLDSKQGGLKQIGCQDYQHGLQRLEKLMKRRLQRGYTLVASH